ncbi:hypothetical protein CO662_05155 [Rhizobium anhuiense]|uniref:DUF4231 domain-containing protein n=1 Tax=Rhizobium anhuiense TaxID=1184720 RepID=A0ABX4JCF9_9HYPH|nr:DUF4231 domain-containing protein [Rhizobium anhuiense]PDS46137.1 hypothetical protein CO668_06380 [Rhizobium anhuiense]PDS52913.1 hypothetical protein CO662_05155 [Rhizobium anhuiense]
MDLFRKRDDDPALQQQMPLPSRYRNILGMLSIAVVVLSVFLISLGALIEVFEPEFPPNVILDQIPLSYISWFMITFGITIVVINVILAARREIARERAERMLPSDTVEIKRQALRDLRTHRNWYARSSRVNQYLWNFLTMGIIVLSGLSSLFSAYGTAVPQWLPMMSSALAALFGTIIVQFRIRDAWQLREQGRIEAEMLVAEAHLIDITDELETLKQAVALRKRAHALEMKQLNQFFVETTAANP